MHPSYPDLLYFIEVAKSGNISRAAERLGITQPSLSLAMQRLENAVGVKLFIRHQKGIALSQAGKQLLSQACELQKTWEQMKGRALRTEEEVAGSYTIGAHPSVALYSLARVIPELLEKYPALTLRLMHDLSRKITEGVISMEIDFAVVVNPVRHPDLMIRPLATDEVGMWKAKSISNALNRPDSDEAVLIADLDLAQSQDLLKKTKRAGTEFSRVIPSSSLEMIVQLTREGGGIGIIPGRVVAALAPGALVRVNPSIGFKDEICAIYRTELKSLPAIQALYQQTLAVLKG